jgi:N-methylhydantoinase B/oxoprolinase/acetone carboxylase alpha subunit
MSYGDIRAMTGSLNVGEARLHEAVRRYGLVEFRLIKEAIKDYSERRMRSEIAEMPDGVYTFEDNCADNDGITDAPARLKVTLTVARDRMTVDYSGSDPQRKGPINCTYGVTASATYNALLHLTDHDIPSNHGCYRPVRIIAPPGTIVNVEYPGASVGGNSEIHPHLVMAIYGALARVLPERVSAHDGGTSALLAIGGVHPATGEIFANLSNEGCGWGGRATKDGNNVLCIPNGNCAIAPIEVLETRYPIVHEQFALHEGSGGAGRNRGGLGCIRQIRITSDEMRVSAFIEKEKIQPWGLFGGQPGKNSAILVRQKGRKEFIKFKEAYHTACNGKFSDVVFHKGEAIKLVTSGGGGYGDPLERDFERIAEDVRQGFISRDQAEREYTVVLKTDGPEVDIERTCTMREVRT